MAKLNKQQPPKKLVQRREFLGGAATMASASFIGRAGGSPWLGLPASAPAGPVPPPAMPTATERRMRRWQEQRWLLDAVIQTVGMEWDQGRIAYTLGPCGPDATADFNGVRARVHKFNDIAREYARAAVRREKMARQFEAEEHTIAARESYFIASLLYGSAQWPIYENTRENVALNEKKVACYSKYMQYADHEIRKVEIPFGGSGKSLPGYFHLPSARRAGRIPAVWSISGMDSFKELSCALYGDKLLERGIAVLALEGPGQGECCIRDIHTTATNWLQAGPLALSWLRSQTEVDPDRVAVQGASMGSFWGTQVASLDDRLKGCAVRSVCHEPGANTIFNMASPTFKLRFMYMAGFKDEGEFDKFAQTLSLKGVGEKVKCPYLVIAGEDDHLSPIEYTYDLLETVSAPKQLLLYEGADHGIGNATSVSLGPSAATFLADWLKDRVDSKPMQTRHMKVDATGQVHESTFEEARKALAIPLPV
ncbi:MAG: esterase FrsA [Acidobacteriia bacterium]|nr:esterase FrsA [Terriglobia bacterium]